MLYNDYTIIVFTRSSFNIRIMFRMSPDTLFEVCNASHGIRIKELLTHQLKEEYNAIEAFFNS